MYKTVKEMFQKSSYKIHDKKYIVTSVKELPESRDHFMVSIDGREITVITEVERESELNILEKNQYIWVVVSLDLHTPFMRGTLAAVNSAAYKLEMNNFIVSTYSLDYILIRDADIPKVKLLFSGLGFKEK